MKAIDAAQFESLKKQFIRIQEDYGTLPQSDTFNDQIIYAFYQLLITDLAAIFLSENPQLDTVEKALQEFLANYRQITKQNLLSPTAIPQADLTLFICKIAVLVCGDKKPIEMLFEGVQWESIKAPYPNLDESISLEYIIKTHIVSDDGKTLIPIQCLTEDNLVSDLQIKDMYTNAHYNPYDPSYVKEITPNEAKRLIEHSRTTEELNNAYGRYYELSKNNAKDLYSQLDRLCRLLRIESAQGRGTEEKAGEGAFVGVAQFGIFYAQLSVKQKKQIPADVKAAIHFLLNVSSKYKGDMVDRIETCAATRKDQIEKAITGKKEILAGICLEPSLIEKQKQDALTQAEGIIKDLKQQFQQGKYDSGNEKLGFNCALLEKLDLEFHVENATDLELFYKLSANEMEVLLTNSPILQDEIIVAIETFDNLIILTHHLSIEKLELFLVILVNKLRDVFVTDQEDYLALIMSHERQETLCILDYYFGGGYNIPRNVLDQGQYNLLMEWRTLKSKFLSDLGKELNNNNYENAKSILDNISNGFLKTYAYGVYISYSKTINTLMINEFFKSGIHPSTKDRNGNTLFYRAADNKWSMDSYLKIMQHAYDTKKLSTDDWTRALTDYYNAASAATPEIVIAFVKAGANPLTKVQQNKSIFQLAYSINWTADNYIQLLRSAIGNKKLSDNDLNQVYSDYISHADKISVRIIQLYFQVGVNPLTKDAYDHTVFHRAAVKEWSESSYLGLIQDAIDTQKLNGDDFTQLLTDYLNVVPSTKINPKIVLAFHHAKASVPVKECGAVVYVDAATQTETDTESPMEDVMFTVETEAQTKCKLYMLTLDRKLKDLKRRDRCEHAVDVLEPLLKHINDELIGTKDTSTEMPTQWVENCLNHIKMARPVLDQHRGEHPLIMNVLNILARFCSFLVSIVTLGAAPYLTGRNAFRLFPYFETDTSRKLSDFEDYLRTELSY